jgi:hypothetical protein
MVWLLSADLDCFGVARFAEEAEAAGKGCREETTDALKDMTLRRCGMVAVSKACGVGGSYRTSG